MPEQLASLRPHAPPQPWWLSRGALIAWWMVAGAALGLGLGVPPVQRTQEARVLETARQMLGSGWRGWMGPMLNGQPRLRKPPLTYWMAATAYEVAGVGEGAGRLPTALLGGLTVGVTFACARWLFGTRAAFFAAACLLCSYLFFRFSRLAETDAPATFFVTAAVCALWRGIEGSGFGVQGSGVDADVGLSLNPGPRTLNPSIWFHLGAAATALAILSKGPPGAYPPLFLLAMVALRQDWKPLRRFITSGAPLTLIFIAAPWFVYVFHTFGVEQWRRELDDLSGQDHPGHYYQYFYELFAATAPWCLLLPAALLDAVRNRQDPRLHSLLTWLAVIFLPLCLIGNKQFHYLLPMMPPAMILIGWWIETALSKPQSAPLLDATMVGSAIAIPGIVVSARVMLGGITRTDWALAAAIAAALLAVGWVWRRHGRAAGLLVYLAGVLVVLVVTVSLWMPRLEGEDSRALARQIKASFGGGPYCFYGRNLSLPLCFNLRVAIPQKKTANELQQFARDEPHLVVIAKTQPLSPAPALPAGFVEQRRIAVGRQMFIFYRHSGDIVAGS